VEEMDYTIESPKSIDEAARDLEKAARDVNFRILAVHNVQDTLAEKGFEIEPLRIFELCHAGFAYKALSRDINTAMFMPCKIILRINNGRTMMTLVKPSMISRLLPDSGLRETAAEVEKQLIGILDEIK